jgi:phosphoribosylformylglycinamidine synthase
LQGNYLKLLARPGIRSSQHIVRRYDHEVQGGTVVKPLIGQGAKGPSDAAVICPLDTWRGSGPHKGVALSAGINPELGKIDPYAMAWSAVDEAVRNCVAVGADPDQIAILDNFCWGNPRLPDRLGALVQCCRGCFDAAIAHGTPFISGKDSLNNEFVGADGEKHAIPGTLLISAMGIVPDITKTMTSDLKRAGNAIYIIGKTGRGLAGSAYGQLTGQASGDVAPRLSRPIESYRALHLAIGEGLVAACHDCSEGGLLVAAAEMAIGGGLGAVINLSALPVDEEPRDAATLAFGESLGRLVVEITPDNSQKFERTMEGSSVARIGEVLAEPRFTVHGLTSVVVEASLTQIEQAWRGHVLAEERP